MTGAHLAFLACVVVATTALPAEAQSGAAAEVLFQEGAAAAETGNYALACEKFEASQKLDPAAGTLLNIADCKEQLGQIASAWQFYLEAAAKFDDDDNRIEYAKEHAEALAPRLPRIELSLADAPEETRVFRDGAPIPLAALGTPLPVDPGEHTYRVEAPHHQATTTSVVALEGETQKVILKLGEPLPAESPVPADATEEESKESYLDETPARPESARRTWGWVSLSVGVAGLTVGSITGLLVIDKKNVVDRECENDFCRTDAGTQAASDGATLSIVSTVSFAVGVLGAGTGAYLLLSGPKEKPTAWLTTAPTFGGGMLSLEGTL